jgi:hypothetical protein
MQCEVDIIEQHYDEVDGQCRAVLLSQVGERSEAFGKQSRPSCLHVPSAKRFTVYSSHLFEIIKSSEPHSSSRSSVFVKRLPVHAALVFC